jgi:hypothetical protein
MKAAKCIATVQRCNGATVQQYNSTTVQPIWVQEVLGVSSTHFRHKVAVVKIAVFWDVMLCGSCKSRLFEEYIASIIKKVKRIGELGTTL